MDRQDRNWHGLYIYERTFEFTQRKRKSAETSLRCHFPQIKKKKNPTFENKAVRMLLCTRAQSSSCVQFFVTSWTVACQTDPMEFSRQEYRRGLPWLPPGYLPDPGIKPAFPPCPALVGGFFTTELPGKPKNALGHGLIETFLKMTSAYSVWLRNYL